MVTVLAMGSGRFAPEFGVGFYRQCNWSRMVPTPVETASLSGVVLLIGSTAPMTMV